MKDTFDIICVAQPSWSGNYAKSTILLMKELAKTHRVLYVDYAYTFTDVLQSLLKRKQAPILRILGIKRRLTKEDKHLYLLSLPPVFPVNFLNEGRVFDWLTKLNAWWISLYINRASKKMNFKRPIVINAFAPVLGKTLLGRLNESMTIYYNYDDIGTASWAAKHGKRIENQFAPLADVVVVSSDQLKKDRIHLNINTTTIKNAVSDDWLIKQNDSAEIKTRPLVGFVGSLDDRVDYPLLYQVAVAMPHVNFQFVGRKVSKNFEALDHLANVKWNEPVSYEKLPEVIQQFDVGIIPFVKSQFTSTIYPLKINEYLAMGKPVIMTSFAELPEFNDIVYRADNYEDFFDAIQNAVNSNSASRSSFYRSVAAKNTWGQRAEEFTSLIKSHLKNL